MYSAYGIKRMEIDLFAGNYIIGFHEGQLVGGGVAGCWGLQGRIELCAKGWIGSQAM